MRIHYLIVCISSIFVSSNTITAFSFKKLYTNFIPGKLHQEVIFEEHAPQKAALLTVKNKAGNITIKTDSQHDMIFLKATKKTSEKEDLTKVTFKSIAQGPEFVIEATYDNQEVKGTIDFDLIVPQKLAVNAHTNDGLVRICQSQCPVKASTTKGSIEVVNAHNSVDVTTHQKGAITLYQPEGRIKAQTNNGTITIHDAQSSVIANTNHGSIEFFAKEIPSTSSIKLATNSGSILLHLPPDVNADLQASTKYGTITSDHYITLKPHTTQLNRTAWKHLQKKVDGTLGSGEAQIIVNSIKSDIKLIEVKA
jgi:putative adhesin